MYDKGDKVITTMGPGVIVYKRMKAPTYSEVEVYSVALDHKVAESYLPPFPTYTGTLFRPSDLKNVNV